jgi:CheY-like chemotaxis protein
VSLRMLVVEDDPLQSMILVAVLEAQGFHVETSADGLDALRKGRLGWFDVVIMDYRLPEIDGLAAARLIGEFACCDKRPTIIALSSSPEWLEAGESRAEQVFDAVIRKPWKPLDLLETITSCREQRHGRAYPAPVEAPADLDDNRVSSPVRVLVADDDEVFMSVLVAALATKGYHVETAVKGIEALRMINRSNYDVAILDYNLLEIDGLVIARLSHDFIQGAHRPRFIALTSSPERLNSREAGSLSVFDDVIVKSSDIQAVLSSMELCVRYKRIRPNPAGVAVVTLMSVTAA